MGFTKGDRTKDLNGNGAWANYVANKRERNNYTMRIDCEGKYYYIGRGMTLTEQQLNDLLPIGLINRTKGIRLDSRQNIY